MPMINGCYFSSREIKRDLDFLTGQGLSEMQAATIQRYYAKRLCTNATLVSVGTCIVVYFAYLGFMAWDVIAK